MFTLDNVVPWGRSFDEYRRMFALTDADLNRRILGCGDGPASFNAEATCRGYRVVSCDPIYQFGKAQIEERIATTYKQVLDQAKRNAHEFVWEGDIPDVEALGAVRMAAMRTFLDDYDAGKRVRRYVDAALPTLPFEDGSFVTAFEDFAIEAFELNAVDYLLKPVETERLQATLDRARIRLEAREPGERRAAALAKAAAAYAQASRRTYLERIPVRRRTEVIILPVKQIASIVSEGELLHITTLTKDRYAITYRLHLLEVRLDPRRFVRLARGTLANIDAITKISPMPGGTYMATLSNGEELHVSRIQSRVLRETLLKL